MLKKNPVDKAIIKYLEELQLILIYKESKLNKENLKKIQDPIENFFNLNHIETAYLAGKDLNILYNVVDKCINDFTEKNINILTAVYQSTHILMDCKILLDEYISECVRLSQRREEIEQEEKINLKTIREEREKIKLLRIA